MAKHALPLPTTPVESIIVTVRGQRVILDSDLAALYGVTTKRLNQQVKRHRDRFPEDFAFLLTLEELMNLRSHSAISRVQVLTPPNVTILRSQIATSRSHGGRRYLPYAFTEHGAIMAATVLNSPQAVRMSVFVVRAFVKMREALVQTRELAAKLAELERTLTERLDAHEDAIALILAELRKLMAPPEPVPPRTPIGFRVGEGPTPYRVRRRRRR